MILKLRFWIAKDSSQTLGSKLSDPHQIKVRLRDLTGKLLDNLAATTARKRCCQGLDILAKGWVGSNRNRQAVAYCVAAAAETAEFGSRPGALSRVLAIGGGSTIRRHQPVPRLP